MSLGDLQDVNVRQNGQGLYVSIGDTTKHLSWIEALNLLQSLVTALPQLENRHDLAWNIRHKPVMRVCAFFSPNKRRATIERTRFRAEVLVLDQVILRSEFFLTAEEAVAEARMAYGDSQIPLIEIIDAPGSELAARDRLIRQLAADLAAAEGMTLQEMLRAL